MKLPAPVGPARHLTWLAAALFSLWLAAPAATLAVGADLPVRVCVSVLPQAFLVDRVGGDRVDVISLTEAGQSPHSFEPTPSLIAALSSSRICFSIGLPFEETILRDLRQAGQELLVIDSSQGIVRREADPAAHRERSERDHSGPLDPHVWLSPATAAVIAANVRDGLVSVDPGGASYYGSNLALLLRELDELDRELTALFEPLEGASLYVFHPAFGYFAEAYGLRQIAIEVDGKGPGARDLAATVSRARDENVSTIFVQPQHPARVATTVAEELGAEIVTLDPLAYDYLTGLREIGHAIADALTPEEGRETAPNAER